jgi:hypothetical protein
MEILNSLTLCDIGNAVAVQETMIGSSIQTWARTALIIWSWGNELVGSSWTNVDELVSFVKDERMDGTIVELIFREREFGQSLTTIHGNVRERGNNASEKEYVDTHGCDQTRWILLILKVFF